MAGIKWAWQGALATHRPNSETPTPDQGLQAPRTCACGHSCASQRADTPTEQPTSMTSRGSRAPCCAWKARIAL